MATTTIASSPEFHPPRQRIVATPGICGGKPRIDGTRITVANVAIWQAAMPVEEIVAQYPQLTLADVYAACTGSA